MAGDIPILVLAKAPDPGQVKTRLVPPLTEGAAAVLAARLARRMLATACGAGTGPVELRCAPDTRHPFFELCKRQLGVALAPQGKGELGTRMGRAFRETLSSRAGALLVGTDVPDATEADFRIAASALADGADAVLGPATDGGYWLLGLRRHDPSLFADMPWGTERVAALTRARMSALGWRVVELAARDDLDRPEDLARLRLRAGADALLQGLATAGAVA
jgi:rSAM/selenodomain-associated transferase 1